MTLRGDMQFQIDALWKCFREAQRRGDAALRSNREGSRIKQEIIDKLKAENEELKRQTAEIHTIEIHNNAIEQAIEMASRAVFSEPPLLRDRVTNAIFTLMKEEEGARVAMLANSGIIAAAD